jgi:hypothetical protein
MTTTTERKAMYPIRKKDVKIGGVYHAKISGNVVRVRLDGPNPYGGWNATNLITGRPVRIKSAAKLRGEA